MDWWVNPKSKFANKGHTGCWFSKSFQPRSSSLTWHWAPKCSCPPLAGGCRPGGVGMAGSRPLHTQTHSLLHFTPKGPSTSLTSIFVFLVSVDVVQPARRGRWRPLLRDGGVKGTWGRSWIRSDIWGSDESAADKDIHKVPAALLLLHLHLGWTYFGSQQTGTITAWFQHCRCVAFDQKVRIETGDFLDGTIWGPKAAGGGATGQGSGRGLGGGTSGHPISSFTRRHMRRLQKN